MTVRINFLPKTYQPPKQLGPKEWAAAAGIAVAVVGTTTYYMASFASVARLEKQVTQQQELDQRVKADLVRAAEIKAQEERVAKAKAELKALQGRHWSGILLALSDLTPQHVTWTDVNVQGDTITLKANSRGLVDVAQLFGGLVDNGEVTEVTLKYVNEDGVKVQVSAKPEDDKAKKEAAAARLMTFRHMSFEMVIRLNPLGERGQRPNGA